MIKVFDKERFVKTLPPKVRGCNTYEQNRILPKADQLDKLMIQLNHPAKKVYLVYDIDRETAFFDWNDLDCPKPTWIARNPMNGHCHLVYQLTEPVGYRGKPTIVTQYCDAVYTKLGEKLHADPNYNGDLTKNPLRDDVWQVTYYGDTYLLAELASSLDMSASDRRSSNFDSSSRNCTLFEKLRKWAAVERRKNTLTWESIQEKAMFLNPKDRPMSISEVKGIAKSVWKYNEWKKTTNTAEFIARQTEKGKKGGKASAQSRSRSAHEKVFLIYKYIRSHRRHNQAGIARALRMSKQTVSVHMELALRMIKATKGIPVVSSEAYQDIYRSTALASRRELFSTLSPHSLAILESIQLDTVPDTTGDPDESLN